MEKSQIVFIHGGDAYRDPEKLYSVLRNWSFNPYEQKVKWRDVLATNVAETHEYHALSMPNSFWADYAAWKIWFEKMVPYLRDGVILIGNSLGASFYLRYLGENTLPVSIAQLHLVAPAVTYLDNCEGFLIDEIGWNEFQNIIPAVHVWHSEDDSIVPISHSEKFLTMYSEAVLHRFTDRGHFLIPSFPEIEAIIKKSV